MTSKKKEQFGNSPQNSHSPVLQQYASYTNQDFPGGSAGKESACNERDLGSIPGLGISPGEGNSYPLQHSGLENSKDCIAHGVTKSQTQLSDFHSLILIKDTCTSIEYSTLQTLLGFPGDAVGTNPPANIGSIPGSGRSPGGGNGNQNSCLENSMDRGGRLQSMGSQSQARLND